MNIYYGSEGGHAIDCAEQIQRKCRDTWDVSVSGIEHFNIESTLSVFVISTAGQGDVPNHMRGIWQKLRRTGLPSDLLENMNYAVFGLGDSSYKEYNVAGVRLFKRLEQLGAVSIHALGLSDAQDETDQAFDQWLAQLMDIVNRLDVPRRFKERLEEMRLMEPVENCILIKQTIVSDSTHDVRLMEFDMDDIQKWAPGDVLVLTPQNNQKDVDLFMQSQGYHEQHVTFSNYSGSLEKFLKIHADITAVPRMSFFELLLPYANEIWREKLLEFSSNKAEVLQYAIKPRRTILEVLHDFNIKIPVQDLHILPIIRPRSFSICSMEKLEIVVSIVNYATSLAVPRKGLCTNWLLGMQGKRLWARIERGNMKLPDTPIVLVGPGTGIAALRAAIQQRLQNGQTQNLLFFGCRSKEDVFFPELAAKYAFSRSGPKTYVQQRIEDEADAVFDYLYTQKGWLYISGASKITTPVINAIRSVFNRLGHQSEDALRELIRDRYWQETWR